MSLFISQAQLSPASTKGSRLKEFLETEKQKVTQRLEQLKQKRSDISSPTRRNAMMENQLGKRDLYKIALSLREANKISQLLKKNMVSTGICFICILVYSLFCTHYCIITLRSQINQNEVKYGKLF